MTSQIGAVVTGIQVEDAITASIKKWMPTYLAEVAAQNGKARTDMPMYRSYRGRLAIDRDAGDQMPSCIVVAPGIANTTTSGGKISASWSVAIGSVVSAQDEESTYDLARLYAAAIRAFAMQQGSFDGFAERTYLQGERYDEYVTTPDQTLCAGIVRLETWVANIVDRSLAPNDPVVDPAQPLPDFPTAQTVEIDINGEKVS